tara:strand:- start:600 stop:749 length:150 start_codon:yes stop_codon:yes gene_type:complete
LCDGLSALIGLFKAQGSATIFTSQRLMPIGLGKNNLLIDNIIRDIPSEK